MANKLNELYPNAQILSRMASLIDVDISMMMPMIKRILLQFFNVKTYLAKHCVIIRKKALLIKGSVWLWGLLIVPCSIISTSTYALTFALPPNGDTIVGEVQHAVVEPGDKFTTIAHRYDVGYYELIEANPQLNPDTPKPWS